MTCRRFKLNTHLVLPLELFAGPGAACVRHEPGAEIELDPEQCRTHDRFIRGRIRALDLTELCTRCGAPALPDLQLCARCASDDAAKLLVAESNSRPGPAPVTHTPPTREPVSASPAPAKE